MRTSPHPLQRDAGVGLFGFFALGFGCIVGSGWVVLLGQWLARASPIGAAAGLLAGAAIMVLVALAYGELASRIPLAGADYVYTREAFGPGIGFAAGWFALLFVLLIVAFEAIVLAWILATIAPVLRSDAIVIGLAGTAIIAVLNLIGMKSAVRFQTVVTVTFLVTALAVLLLAGILGSLKGEPPHDLLAAHSLSGTMWVFSTAALFYNGFQAIPQAVEARAKRVSARAISLVIAVAIGAAGVFYSMVILCSTLAAPWQWTIKQELPAAAAANAALPGLGTILLCAAAISVLKTWNAMFIASVQTVVALSRNGILPRKLAAVTQRGVYAPAIYFVVCANITGLLAGRSAVGPLIEMASISMGFVMTACCAGVQRLRLTRGPAPYTMPGGLFTVAVATLGPCLMAIAAIVSILLKPAFPLELALMLIWAVLGAAFWLFAVRSSGRGAADQALNGTHR